MSYPYDIFGHKVGIESGHAYIHDGKSFLSGYFWSETESTSMVADNESAILVLQPGRSMHILIDVTCAGEAEVYHYKGITTGTTETGTSLPTINKNDYSSRTSNATVYWGSTGIVSSLSSTDITTYPGKLIPGGTGGNAVGGRDGGYSRELNLKAGEIYATQVKNRSGAPAPISITYDWYEPTCPIAGVST